MEKNVRTRSKTGEIYFQFASYKEPPRNLDRRHCHDEYEILYITDGYGKYVIEGDAVKNWVENLWESR